MIAVSVRVRRVKVHSILPCILRVEVNPELIWLRIIGKEADERGEHLAMRGDMCLVDASSLNCHSQASRRGSAKSRTSAQG